MAKTLEIDVEVNTGEAVKDVDKLTGATDKLGEATEGVNKSADNLSGGLSALGGGFGAAINGAKSLGKAFLALALNPIGLVIAALATGILAVKTAFESSEEGQNKYAKIMSVIGAVTGNFVDLLADLGELIIEAFENPKESLDSFATALKNNIVNRFEGMVELIPKLGEAINQLFKGNFSEAGTIAANAVAKVTLGVDDLTGKISAATEATKEFIKEQEREAGLAAKVADQRAKADKIERELIVRRSKLQSEIAELRLKSRQEDQFTAAERRQALLDAQVLEDELLNRETEVLELRRDAQVLENTFSRSNKENLDKEANAIAAVNNQVAARANVARQLQRELNTIQGQIDAENKAKEAEKLKEQEEKDKAEKERLDRIAKEEKERLEASTEAEKQAAAELIAVEKAKKAVRDNSLNNIETSFKTIASLDEDNKALQAANLIAENAFGIARTVQSTVIANAAAAAASPLTLGQPWVTINTAAAGVGIAASIAATAKGLAGLKKGGSAGSKPSLPTPSGGGSASAPKINDETLFSSQTLEGADSENVGSGRGINQIQAVVVESQITDVQNNINDIEARSEIGG